MCLSPPPDTQSHTHTHLCSILRSSFCFGQCFKEFINRQSWCLSVVQELFEYKSCPVSVICPGNKIPKWFSDQTEGSSININLPPDWFDENFLGFALCAVGTIKRHQQLSITCRYNFKFNNGKCQGYEVQLESISHFYDGALSPDHVFVWYHPFIFNDTEWCTEASFEFCSSVVNHNPMLDETYVEKCDVKRCGVGLLYSQGRDAAVAVKTEVT